MKRSAAENSMDFDEGTRIGFSSKKNAAEAVDEICDQTAQPDTKFTVFYCSSLYDLDAVAARVRERLPADKGIGCTTAGEIGPSGYSEASITAFSLAGPDFAAAFIGRSEPARLSPSEVREKFCLTRSQLEAKGVTVTPENTFALHLVDMKTAQTKSVINALANATDDIMVIGGTAADDFKFEDTSVYFDGKFRSHAGVFALIWTARPFVPFHVQGGKVMRKKLIVTATDLATCRVTELNCEVAADEYARAAGLRREDLDIGVFAAYPLMLGTAKNSFSRTVISANDDGSLTFASPIEKGLIFTIAKDEFFIDTLRERLDEVAAAVGRPGLTICCDGAGRRLLARKTGRTEAVNELFRANRSVGFCCFGVQFGTVHTTHSLVAVAVGRGRT